MSQAVYDGQQQQDIHILHTKTDEEEGCVDVTQCIYVYSYIFREKGNKYIIQGELVLLRKYKNKVPQKGDRTFFKAYSLFLFLFFRQK